MHHASEEAVHHCQVVPAAAESAWNGFGLFGSEAVGPDRREPSGGRLKPSRHREGGLTGRVGKRASVHQPRPLPPRVRSFTFSESCCRFFLRTFKLIEFLLLLFFIFFCFVSAERRDVTSASLERFTASCCFWPHCPKRFCFFSFFFNRNWLEAGG